jgi:SH3-like domain-containing protein
VSHMSDSVDPGVPLVVLGEVSGWLRALHPSGEVGWVAVVSVRVVGIAR